MKIIFGALVYIFLLAGQSEAGSKLPRGKIAPLNSNLIKKSKPADSIDLSGRVNCLDDFSSPIGGTGFFSKKKNVFYHMSKVKSINKKRVKGRKWYRYNLHEINLRTKKVKVLAALDLPEIDALVAHGDNEVTGISAVIFSAGGAVCKSGYANYVTIVLNQEVLSSKKKGVSQPPAVQKSGHVSIVASNKNDLIYSHDKNALVQLDFRGFQTRYKFINLPKNERPLYTQVGKLKHYTWKHAKEGGKISRGLVAYEGNYKGTRKLRFVGSDKLLQQGNKFGVAQYDSRTNSIRIKELKSWSGTGRNRNFVITLPTLYKVVDSSLKVDFSRRLVLVMANAPLSMKRWKRVFLYDYEKGWELTSYRSKVGEYPSYAAFSPDDNYVVLVSDSMRNNLTDSLQIYSFATQSWSRIGISEVR